MTTSFTGKGQTGNWSDPANWTSVLGPAAVDLVSVSATQSGSFTAPILMLLGHETVSFAGHVATTSTDACQSFMVCDGALAAFAGTASLSDAGGLIVGNDAQGTLTAAAHATLAAGNVKIGLHADGVGSMRLDGATLATQGAITVGMQGQGTLALTDYARVQAGGGLGIGVFQGSAGTVTLASGATVQVAGDATVGAPTANSPYGGSGSLSIGAGSTVSIGGALRVGQHGTLTLTGGSLMAKDGTTGTSDILAGGRIAGHGALAAPTLVITPGATIEASGGTLALSGIIGGTGQLTIDAGSTLALNASQVTGVTIDFAGANAALTLAGAANDMATIAGFAGGDSIAVSGIDGFAWNAAKGLLALTEHGATEGTLRVAGSYASNAFTLSETSAGAVITLAAHH